MKLNYSHAALLLMTGFIVISCSQEKKEESKEIPVKETAELPVQMIKSPDGNYYFPENVHRPKSDKDSIVWVKPSDFKQ